MSPSPDVLTRQWFQEVWNEGREEAIDRMLSPRAVVHGLAGADLDANGFKGMWRAFRAAFSDLHVTVEGTIVDGDTCVARCRVRGRHTGDALGGPPSGRPIEIEGVTTIRFADGTAVEGWNVFDFLGMYQQIGWVTNPVRPVAAG